MNRRPHRRFTRAALFFAAFALACTAARGVDCAVAAAPSAPAAPIDTKGLRIGLALGSGSLHGLAHVGVLEELEARGLDVRVVAGTSVGAIVGSLWASGMPAREIERVARGRNWGTVGRFSGSWQGLLTNAGLREQLTPLYRGRPIETWPRRFGAVATHLADGRRRILSSGDGARAVQASSAVPVMFLPVIVAGEKLGDGALVEPVPVDAARVLGAEFVIAVDVGYRPYEEPASGLAGYTFQSMHILMNALGEREMRDADFPIRLDLHRELMRCGSSALVAAGRAAVRRSWPELAQALKLRAAARPALDPAQSPARARR